MRIMTVVYSLFFFSTSAAFAQTSEFNPCEVDFSNLSFVHEIWRVGNEPKREDYTQDILDWFAKKGITHNPSASVKIYATSTTSEYRYGNGSTGYKSIGEYHVTYPGYEARASSADGNGPIDVVDEVYGHLPEHSCKSGSKIKLIALDQRPNTAKLYEGSSDTKELALRLATERDMYKIEFPSWYGRLSFVPQTLDENSRLAFEFAGITRTNTISHFITSYKPLHVVDQPEVLLPLTMRPNPAQVA